MKIRTGTIVLAFAALTAVLTGSPTSAVAGPAADPACSNPARICGLDAPEDLVAVDQGAEVIASRLGAEGLNVIETKTHKVSMLDPTSLPEKPDARYPCPNLKTSGAFISHGLNVKREADGSEHLFVVRHGGREAIEIFQFSRPGDVGSLTWLGCVVLPKGFQGNAVVGRRDGGFYATSMTDAGDAPGGSKLAKLYAGQASGVVLGWMQGKGFHQVSMGTMSGPNGVELSPDDRWLFVNGWSSREIVRIDLDHPDAPARRLQVAFMPDNLHWAGDGSLIAAGVRATAAGVFECAGTHPDGTPCATHWTVVSIDPASMTLKAQMDRDDRSGFGDVSVALPVDRTLWLGDFDGRDIAIEPDQLSTAAHR